MSERRGDEYHRSLFDKQGPEAAHTLQRASSLIIPFVAGGLIGGALAAQKDLSAPIVALSALAGAFVLAAWWWYVVSRVSHGAGKLFGEFIQPTAAGSYERQYSREDSLVMRGDVGGALASYEEIILESPDDPQPRLRAAELYSKSELRERRSIDRAAPSQCQKAGRRLRFQPARDLYLAWPGLKKVSAGSGDSSTLIRRPS
jgi:hypothetical protein